MNFPKNDSRQALGQIGKFPGIPTIPETARVTIEKFGDSGLSDHEERQCDAAIQAATAEMRRRHDESMGAYREPDESDCDCDD